MSSHKTPNDNLYGSAFNLACFVADMFALRLINIPTMHECLGILLHEMVGVEHVYTVQTMVQRAGAKLWQGADSHIRLREFTTGFVERTSSLPDNASLTGQKASIQQLIQVRASSLHTFGRITLICDYTGRKNHLFDQWMACATIRVPFACGEICLGVTHVNVSMYDNTPFDIPGGYA